MDYEQLRMRMNVDVDRLSGLPDDLIHKILSFADMRQAIGTSVLSSRWRFIWTSMPYLTISADDFRTMPKFSKFATNVLSRRNNLAEVYSLKFTLRVKTSWEFLKRILKYAFSHNIQQLEVICVLENHIDFPLSLFSSQSLKHLSLTTQHGYCGVSLTTTWELPALTTLVLKSVVLCVDGDEKCVDLFSKCANLKNLTLNDVFTNGLKCLTVIHPRLSSLTLENCRSYNVKDVNVVAPQLKNLTIRRCPGKHAISAPELTSMVYRGSYPNLAISTEGFHSLEKADICISYLGGPDNNYALPLISLFQLLHNVKFLTLNMEIIEFLSSSTDLILPQPSPFVNLKSLNIHPDNLYHSQQKPEEVTTFSPKLKSYFLDSSPGSTFTMVLREEIIAQKMMARLGVILEQEKDNIMTNMAPVEQGKVNVESNKAKAKMDWKTELIKSSWETLGVELQQRKEKACLIISKMQDIKELVTKLPESNKDKIQPCFSSLCAEANIVIGQLVDRMKMQCEEIRSLSNVHFDQLATTYIGAVFLADCKKTTNQVFLADCYNHVNVVLYFIYLFSGPKILLLAECGSQPFAK